MYSGGCGQPVVSCWTGGAGFSLQGGTKVVGMLPLFLKGSNCCIGVALRKSRPMGKFRLLHFSEEKQNTIVAAKIHPGTPSRLHVSGANASLAINILTAHCLKRCILGPWERIAFQPSLFCQFYMALSIPTEWKTRLWLRAVATVVLDLCVSWKARAWSCQTQPGSHAGVIAVCDELWISVISIVLHVLCHDVKPLFMPFDIKWHL